MPESKERTAKPSEEEPQDKAVPVEVEEGDFRLIAVNNTPFFTRLRSGLRSEAKPSRYLDKGTRVKLLEENAENLFSRIQLPDRKKGWVPSRLVNEQAPEEAATGTEEAPPSSEPAEELVPIPGPEEPTLPAEGGTDMGPLDDSQLPPVSIPEVDIVLPQGIPAPASDSTSE